MADVNSPLSPSIQHLKDCGCVGSLSSRLSRDGRDSVIDNNMHVRHPVPERLIAVAAGMAFPGLAEIF
jgi:hypothetical protein